MPYDKATPWAKNLVNLNQSPAERQAKYRLALSLGANPAHARSMRDWRWPKIQRAFGCEKVKNRRQLGWANK